MGKHPPKTQRYCLNCKEMTKFKYDPFTGHSYCLECGRNSQFAKRKNPNKLKFKKEN